MFLALPYIQAGAAVSCGAEFPLANSYLHTSSQGWLYEGLPPKDWQVPAFSRGTWTMSKPWISSRDGGKGYPGKARSSALEEKNPGHAALCWPWVSAFSGCTCCREKVAGIQGAIRLKLEALNSCLAVTHICKGVSFRDQGIG